MSGEAIAAVSADPDLFKSDMCKELIAELSLIGAAGAGCAIGDLQIESARRLSVAPRRLSNTIFFDAILSMAEEIADAGNFKRAVVIKMLVASFQDSLTGTIVSVAAGLGIPVADAASLVEVVYVAGTMVTSSTTTSTATTTIGTTATPPEMSAMVPGMAKASSAVFAMVIGVSCVLVVCCALVRKLCKKPMHGSVSYTGWSGDKGMAEFQVGSTAGGQEEGEERLHIVWRLDTGRAERVLASLQLQADNASGYEVQSSVSVRSSAARMSDSEDGPDAAGRGSWWGPGSLWGRGSVRGGDVAVGASNSDSDVLPTAAAELVQDVIEVHSEEFDPGRSDSDSPMEHLGDLEDSESQEPLAPFMEPRTVVEYYSKSNKKWLTARLTVEDVTPIGSKAAEAAASNKQARATQLQRLSVAAAASAALAETDRAAKAREAEEARQQVQTRQALDSRTAEELEEARRGEERQLAEVALRASEAERAMRQAQDCAEQERPAALQAMAEAQSALEEAEKEATAKTQFKRHLTVELEEARSKTSSDEAAAKRMAAEAQAAEFRARRAAEEQRQVSEESERQARSADAARRAAERAKDLEMQGDLTASLEPVLRYGVEVLGNRTHERSDVPLWRIRPLFQEGDLVEVFSRRSMQWVPAAVAGKPPFGGAQGNTVPVQMEEDGAVKTVSSLGVRRLIADGTLVKVYVGPLFGWRRGVVDFATVPGEPPPIDPGPAVFDPSVVDPPPPPPDLGLGAVTGVLPMAPASDEARVRPLRLGGSVAEDFVGVECPWRMVPFREFGDEGSMMDPVWVPSYVVLEDGAWL